MGLTFEESLTAATSNAAHSLDLAVDRGSLEIGKRADFVLVTGDAINLIRVGVPAIAAVYKDGRLTWPYGHGHSGP
jgi:imidazolonepropionase